MPLPNSKISDEIPTAPYQNSPSLRRNPRAIPPKSVTHYAKKWFLHTEIFAMLPDHLALCVLSKLTAALVNFEQYFQNRS